MQLPTKPIDMSYDYREVVTWLQKTGQTRLGKKFIIPENERGIIFGMLAWFLQDELVAKEMNIDLNKGIMLSGPIGCGKTTLFRLMRQLPSKRKSFGMVSTRQVVSEFIQSGYEVLENYSRGSLYNEQRIPKNYCFDDLGTEATSKYYGNDCNVMAEILLTRYDLYKEKDIITHITTNLTAGEIETIYGNRLRSRMREMFNLFGYEENSGDKRK
ncbi:AAA family ATPase [Riemerella anatipestifer]|uniref:AAA family ATPase n=1 Tax=Riemerella anatipestifer TaxID=34085 RepID=UPI002265A93A|nr:AAA family ATPase [Riemerella anatipestifer]UZX27779.1 ATPase [Riemerella anatipestifer]